MFFNQIFQFFSRYARLRGTHQYLFRLRVHGKSPIVTKVEVEVPMVPTIMIMTCELRAAILKNYATLTKITHLIILILFIIAAPKYLTKIFYRILAFKRWLFHFIKGFQKRKLFLNKRICEEGDCELWALTQHVTYHLTRYF